MSGAPARRRSRAGALPAAPVPDVEVRASGIEGQGIFAARAFVPWERIHRITVVREVTAEAPLRPELGERWDYCDYPDGRVVLVGFPDRCTNHSCDPNAWVLYEGEGGAEPWLVARRPIAAGDEITLDYSVNLVGGASWPCRCGAARCRHEVVGDFFSLPREIQLEYRPLLAGWFVRRNRERVAGLDASAGLR